MNPMMHRTDIHVPIGESIAQQALDLLFRPHRLAAFAERPRQ